MPTRVGNAAAVRSLEADNTGGGSDDIGDISWNVPTITLRYPSNIPGLPGHNWAERHRDGDADCAQGRHRRRQGAGDDDDRPPAEARSRHGRVGLLQERADATIRSTSRCIRPQDQPAIDLNKDTMAKYRDQMKKYYFDPTKYKTYLEQLGIQYPTVREVGRGVGPEAQGRAACFSPSPEPQAFGPRAFRRQYHPLMLRPYRGRVPSVHPTAFVDQSAQVIGDVEIGPDSSVWMNAVVRGDVQLDPHRRTVQRAGRHRRARHARHATRPSSATM